MKIINIVCFVFSITWMLTGCGDGSGDRAVNEDSAAAESADTSAQNQNTIVPPNAKVEKLSEDQFEFVEGPAWDNSGGIYFTDIPNNSIYRYDLATEAFTLVTENTAGANGLMFNRQNNLLACEQETGAVSVWSTDGTRLETLVAEYDGTRFNRPNDLVVDKNNGIYFTDPSWSEERPQEIKGVYYLDAEGNLSRLIEDMDKPNGIILSSDESTLYIADTDSFEVRAYPVTAPGQLGERIVFAALSRPDGYDGKSSGADGVALDIHGNLYVTSRFGVQIFSPEGEFIDLIEIPEAPTNCVFSGENLDTLFITARKNVYAIKLNTRGVIFPQ